MIFIIAVAGFILCFFGRRLLRVAIPAISFLIGFALCGAFLPGFFNIEGVRLLIYSVIGGAALAVIAAVSVNVCVFFAGGYAGIAALRFTLQYFPAVFGDTSGVPIALVGVLLFVILGVIALRLKRTVLNVFTAYTGAYVMVSAVVSLAARTDPILITGSVLAFTLAGFLAQKKQ